VDNTAATAISVTTSDTHAADTWTAVGLELIVAAGCARPPTFTYVVGSAIYFNSTAPLSGTNTAASGQGASPAITITNKGPGVCSIAINLASSPPAGTENQWNTSNNAPGIGYHDISTSPVTTCASITEAATCQLWMWSRIATASSTTAGGTSITLTITES